MDSTLRVVGVIIGRLTGKVPQDAQLVYEAMNTPSVSKPGKKMYRGLKSDDSVSVSDALVLLQNHGIGTVVTRHAPGAEQDAYGDLLAALTDPAKTAVAVLAKGPVVVTAVDTAVWLDAGGGAAPEGASPFISKWAAAGLGLIVAEVTGPTKSPPADWSRLRPRRESAGRRE
ncbi:hypothetical protein ACNUDN_22010 [Mycobacterium sp. smrl_JER01]|uniref:hypothetical protein n=1 Tax=Mycobacterium sp. smrl_JER01 TaxID=3402633 RepID=UPI003AC8FC00